MYVTHRSCRARYNFQVLVKERRLCARFLSLRSSLAPSRPSQWRRVSSGRLRDTATLTGSHFCFPLRTSPFCPAQIVPPILVKTPEFLRRTRALRSLICAHSHLLFHRCSLPVPTPPRKPGRRAGEGGLPAIQLELNVAAWFPVLCAYVCARAHVCMSVCVYVLVCGKCRTRATRETI